MMNGRTYFLCVVFLSFFLHCGCAVHGNRMENWTRTVFIDRASEQVGSASDLDGLAVNGRPITLIFGRSHVFNCRWGFMSFNK